MEYSLIGTRQIKLSRLCFGCWGIGGHGYGTVNDSHSIAAIQYAAELGVNFFDTADVYGFGHSEKILGQALKGMKNTIIASKFGVSWDARGNTQKKCNVSGIRVNVENSLRRLNRDYIDIYQLHWHDGVTPLEEIFFELGRLKKDGLIRYIGCSNLSFQQILIANKGSNLDCVQLPFCFNNMTWNMDLQYLKENLGMLNLVYGVLGRGVFSGNYSVDSVYLKNDTRGQDQEYLLLLKKSLTFLNYLKEIADKYNKTTCQVAIRWVLDTGYVSCAIVGMKTMSQVETNIGSFGWEMHEDDRRFLLDKAHQLFCARN